MNKTASQPTPSQLISNIPTSVLLADAEASSSETASSRAHSLSNAIQKGALVCLAATIPLAVARNFERNMAYAAAPPQRERRIVSKGEYCPALAPVELDLSTLQDAVSGLGFILTAAPATPSLVPDFIYLPPPRHSHLSASPPSGISA